MTSKVKSPLVTCGYPPRSRARRLCICPYFNGGTETVRSAGSVASELLVLLVHFLPGFVKNPEGAEQDDQFLREPDFHLRQASYESDCQLSGPEWSRNAWASAKNGRLPETEQRNAQDGGNGFSFAEFRCGCVSFAPAEKSGCPNSFGNKSSMKICTLKTTPTFGPVFMVERNDRFQIRAGNPCSPTGRLANSSGGSTATAVKRIIHGKLDQRNHVTEWFGKADVLHMLLEIGKAVFDGDPPFDGIHVIILHGQIQSHCACDGEGF